MKYVNVNTLIHKSKHVLQVQSDNPHTFTPLLQKIHYLV